MAHVLFRKGKFSCAKVLAYKPHSCDLLGSYIDIEIANLTKCKLTKTEEATLNIQVASFTIEN